MVCHSLLQWTTFFSEFSTMIHPSWVALHSMVHSFIGLNIVAVHVIWLAFCDCGFHSVCSLIVKDKRLMKASGWERLIEGETGSCSDGNKRRLFQQHKRRLYTRTSPDGQYRNQTDCILCSQRWRSSIQSAKTIPGADCGSDHELLITKFRLKLKTIRPLRYDLNQIPYDYTVEVTNRFKGLDLIDRVPEELQTEVHDIV